MTHTRGYWALFDQNGVLAVMKNGREVVKWTGFDGTDYPRHAVANARLIVAACNSYDRHFGARAVETAEADLLGDALDALRAYVHARESGHAGDHAIAGRMARAVLARVEQEPKP